MGRHFFASAVLLAWAVADRSVLEESDVDVDAALHMDDQCSDGSAHCALNALQIRAARVPLQPDSESLSTDDLAPERVEGVSWPGDDVREQDVGSVVEGRSMDALVLAEGASGDVCNAGMVGKMREKGPECFDACPQICKPLAEAVVAFFHNGGAPAARRAICQDEEKFYCTMEDENLDKCKTFVESARHMGVEFPQTVSAFQIKCLRYKGAPRI